MVPANSAVDPAITPATDITTNIGIHSRQSVVAAHARSERARQELSAALNSCASACAARTFWPTGA